MYKLYGQGLQFSLSDRPRPGHPRLLGPFWPPGPRRLTSSLTFEVGPAARSPWSAGTPQGRPTRSARHRTASLPPSGRGGRTQSGHWVPGAAGTQALPLEAKPRCLRRLLVLGEGTVPSCPLRLACACWAGLDLLSHQSWSLLQQGGNHPAPERGTI